MASDNMSSSSSSPTSSAYSDSLCGEYWSLSSSLMSTPQRFGVDAKGVVDRSKAMHRTGTLLFMAHDLLTTRLSPPRHLYRHDLESFLYFLIWAMAHYDLVKKRTRRTVPSLKAWERDVGQNSNAKGSIIISDYRRERLFADIQEPFKPLIDECLLPLLNLFRQARLGETTDREDPVTLDGALTFETFMGAIKRTPRPIPPPSA